VYVVLDENDDDETSPESRIEEALSADLVDGYFHKSDEDFYDWFRIFQAEIAQAAVTPFYDQLKRYVSLAKDSFHTPGHSGGDSFRLSPWVGDFYDFVGEEMIRADLSVSVASLDSLLHPTGVIQEAQRLAAEAFGARETFFVTNGTSTSNKVIIQSILAPGDKLILDRNCHKSVHHGVVMSGSYPVYLDSSVNTKYGIFGPVPKKRIFKTIDENQDAKLLVLTSCTYDGLRYDLRPIIDYAHSFGIKVLIDEAWYAYGRFHPVFRPTALECGADFVSHSTHKTLSALSQAAMIHVNDPNFDRHAFREAFNMFASTSPQYTIIASLDVARKQVQLEGFKLLDQSLKLASELARNIDSTNVFKVLKLDDLLPDDDPDLDKQGDRDGIQLDPTKLTIDISKSAYSADDFQKELFERYNIQVEKSTFSTVTLLITIGTTRSKVSRLYDALLRMSKTTNKPPNRAVSTASIRAPSIPPQIPHMTPLGCLPRDAFFEQGERLSLFEAGSAFNRELLGRIACDGIVPYPPGIPILASGQIINQAILEYLTKLITVGKKAVEVHGLTEGSNGELLLRVLTEEEVKIITGRSQPHTRRKKELVAKADE